MATQKAKETAKQLAGEPLTPNFTSKDYSIFFAAGALCCTMCVEAFLGFPLIRVV